MQVIRGIGRRNHDAEAGFALRHGREGADPPLFFEGWWLNGGGRAREAEAAGKTEMPVVLQCYNMD